MASALFTFHGLFPDEVRQEGQTLVSKVLFDVEYQGKLHAHHMAHVIQVDGEDQPQVTSDFTLPCVGLADAVFAYLDYVYGPQSHSVSHGGPKGPNLRENALHVEWQTRLEIPES
ncbi:MAG: hypothetical protein OXN23_07125 [Gammaproteobacteria bacterium]|nr:hypothetical protein [Gammaproteobacteria bacterium]MDE0301609.1 hypothetical protein [Gammaproteobacteria bacterium]MDE0612763.1 hypothetical protein [Gammaproteobacteria bacterium]